MQKLPLLLLILFVSNTLNAQRGRDTLWGGSPNAPFYNRILQAPVTSGETEQILIHPTARPFCFDKRIKIKSTVGSRLIEQCLYLDTKGGLVAYLPPVTGGTAEMCDIKPDEEKFVFSVMGLKGNVYTYKNQKKKNTIKHWYTTGNSQTYLYQTPTNTGVYTLHKKTERRDYCGGKIKATAYKYDGATAPTMFIFGNSYPPDINVTANKYIGNFGIGYQYTDKGLYIIMEMQSSGYTCKITDIEDVDVCFNPAPFQFLEGEMVTKQTESNNKEREKIERDAAKATGPCASEKMAVIEFRRENLRKQEENLQNSQQGNVYQNVNTQKAYANMMDPLTSIQGSILETKVSICNTEQSIQRSPNNNRAQEKLSCLRTQLRQLMSTETQMRAIDTRYTNEPSKALLEKSRLMLQSMGGGCN